MLTFEPIIFFIVIVLFLLGVRYISWEDYYKKHPKERDKNKATRKKLKKRFIELIKSKFNRKT